MRTPIFLSWERAVEDAFDAGIPGHYGDPSGEQWALEEGNALVDFSDLDVISVTGPDRLTWLTTLSTNVISDLVPGQSREILFLDPHGHITYAAAVSDNGSRTLLIVDAGYGAGLVEFLNRMKFALRVEIADISSEVAVLGRIVVRPEGEGRGEAEVESLPVDEAAHVASWVDPWPQLMDYGASYHRVANGESWQRHPGSGRQRVFDIVRRDAATSVARSWVSRGGVLAGRIAWEALRIEDYRPRLAREVDERTLPHELDWLRTAVHLNKGCYCGQEAVARIVNLGKPPRRLTLLHLDGSQSRQVKPGDSVQLGTRSVGRVTSVARHADLGPIALVMLKRGVRCEETVVVMSEEGEVAAAQESIVDVEGRSSVTPHTRPGSELRGRGVGVSKPPTGTTQRKG